MKFYSATEKYNTKENHVNAPLLRGKFTYNGGKAILKVAVVGMYELYLNGERITFSHLGPQRTNPNHRNYVDKYDLTNTLVKGENIFGVMLGNGFSCSVDEIWGFNKVNWIHAPKIAMSLKEDDKEIFDAKDLVTFPSEITFDDFHAGEHIDANSVVPNWKELSFDDSNWKKVIEAEAPKGKLVETPYCPIRIIAQHKPIKVIKGDRGYIFDFGKSMAGNYVFNVKGEKGKMIKVFASDGLLEGRRVFYKNMNCERGEPYDYYQCDWLTFSGNKDTFAPKFSYKGCRYVEFVGLTDEEASSCDITFFEMSSITRRRGTFECDNEVINKLQKCVEQSDISNFLQFPTDCPQREKNGWTADATLSTEQFLLNFDCAYLFKIYVQAIVDAQREDGALPGIVPTDTWGFAWGAGPGWDNCIFELPYRVYLYSGDKEVLQIVGPAIKKYLKYMMTKEDKEGLFAYGLEDWLPIKTHTDLRVTDSILCKSMCDAAVKIFNILDDKEGSQEAQKLSDRIKENIFKKWKCYFNEATTQTHIAMGIYHNIYDIDYRFNSRCHTARELLMHWIDVSGGTMDFGAIGNRFMWRTLGDLGYVDTAVEMITQDRYPSFKTAVLDLGLTTLPEGIMTKGIKIDNLPDFFYNQTWSFNHHFWGDISAFFYRYLAGIKVENVNSVNFSPLFAKKVKKVHSTFAFANGIFEVDIKHNEKTATAKVFVPAGVKTEMTIPEGYKSNIKSLKEGLNIIKFSKI